MITTPCTSTTGTTGGQRTATSHGWRSWLSGAWSTITGVKSPAASSRATSEQGTSKDGASSGANSVPSTKPSPASEYRASYCPSWWIPVDSRGPTNLGGLLAETRDLVGKAGSHYTKETREAANGFLSCALETHPDACVQQLGWMDKLKDAVDTQVAEGEKNTTLFDHATCNYFNRTQAALKTIQSQLSDVRDAYEMAKHDADTQFVYDQIGTTCKSLERERRQARSWKETAYDFVSDLLPAWIPKTKTNELQKAATEARTALRNGGLKLAMGEVEDYLDLGLQASVANIKGSRISYSEHPTSSPESKVTDTHRLVIVASKGPERDDPSQVNQSQKYILVEPLDRVAWELTDLDDMCSKYRPRRTSGH